MKQLIFFFAVALLFSSCKMAPWEESYDFWVLITVLFGTSLIWLYKAIRAHFSGSYYWITNWIGQRIRRIDSDERLPLYKIAWFKFFLWHLFCAIIMFCLIAFGGSFWEVWFPYN